MADYMRGHALSPGQFQKQASKGESLLASKGEQSTAGLTGKSVSHRAYQATREEWGGGTYHPATGEAVSPSSGYAVSVKNPGQSSIAVDAGSRQGAFHSAMKQARHEFAPQLAREGTHLGIFHDADTHKVEFDPVTIAGSRHEADAIGAATGAKGGAYNFANGQGRFAPHIRGQQ